MAKGIRTGDPRGFNKGCSSMVHESSRVWPTPEGRRTYRPKRCGNSNKDEDNSLKTLNDINQQASSQKFRQLINWWFPKKYLKKKLYHSYMFFVFFFFFFGFLLVFFFFCPILYFMIKENSRMSFTLNHFKMPCNALVISHSSGLEDSSQYSNGS